jgi:diguanylate cyclase (GGDEF)-like protein
VKRPRSSNLTAWLYPTDLDRARLLDMSRRMFPAAVWLVVVCLPFVTLLTLRVGPVVLIPFVVVAGLVVPLVRVPRERLPIILLFVGDLVAALAIAADIALTGGSAAPGISLMVWPIVAAAGRHTLRGFVVHVSVCLAATLVACLFAVNRSVAYADLRLVAFLTMIGGVAVLVVALTRAERHAREQSLIDPLTGTLNRLALNRRIEELDAQAAVSDGALCVVAGDIDHFKEINDAHGHDVGDVVLRAVADVLRSNLRAFPLLYRTGGEEFVAVLPGLDCGEGEEIAERLRRAVETTNPGDVAVTMSFGVAASAGDDLDTSTVLSAADHCLYQAKRDGRNRVVTRRTGSALRAA